ncbi:hypothetical protein X961_5824 [Burkholderia pseudomallei MSHR5613]|nr:hypothetical protein X961_5824 [Burkholderia pseudomallei MSHR5613]
MRGAGASHPCVRLAACVTPKRSGSEELQFPVRRALFSPSDSAALCGRLTQRPPFSIRAYVAHVAGAGAALVITYSSPNKESS